MTERSAAAEAVGDLKNHLEAARAAAAAIATATDAGAWIEQEWITAVTAYEEARAASAGRLGLPVNVTVERVDAAFRDSVLLQRLADMPDAGPQEPIVAPLRARAQAALDDPSVDLLEEIGQLVRIARLDAAARAGASDRDEVAELTSIPGLAAAATLASLAALPLPPEDVATAAKVRPNAEVDHSAGGDPDPHDDGDAETEVGVPVQEATPDDGGRDRDDASDARTRNERASHVGGDVPGAGSGDSIIDDTSSAPPDVASAPDGAQAVDVGPVLASLIREGRDGLAHHLAAVAGVSETLPLALHATTCAAAIRTSAGPAAAASRLAIEDLATTTSELDHASRLLALAAAVTITCTAPHVGGTEIIDQHGVALAGFPALVTFAEAVRSTGDKGITIFEHVVGSTASLVDLEAHRRALVERASSFIEHPPQNRFPRAADLLRDLVGSSESDVHTILAAVAEDDDAAISSVEEAVTRLSSRGAVDAVIDTPVRRRKRPAARRRIVGEARQSLRENLAEVVDIGQQWVSASRSLSLPNRGASWLAEPIDQLRAAAGALVDAQSPAGWAGGDGDPLVAAAADRVTDAVRRAAAVVLGGQAPAGPDREPWRLLGRELLRDPEIRLSSDLTPRSECDVERLFALASSVPDWRDAALRRAERGDAGLVELAIAELDITDDRRSELDRETARLLDDARRSVDRLREGIDGDIAAFFLKGAIAEDDWQELSREQEYMTLAADDLAIGDRIDDLRALKLTVAEAAASYVAENEPKLRAQAEGLDLSREAQRQLGLAFDTQDLATAERIVLDARRGREPVAEEDGPQPFELMFPRVTERLAGSDSRGSTLADRLARDRTLFDLTVRDRVDDDYLERAGEGLRAVDRLGGTDAERRAALREIMALLGLPTTDVKRGSQESGWWLHEVSARVSDKAVVPQFGSDAGGRYRILVMRAEDATEDRITSWLSEHASERATIILYDRVLSTIVRRRLAERARRAAPTEQALVIDLSVVASVAALSYGSFETTVRLALPFTAINPYNPYASGLVPLEMFYGRRDVRADLLSPSGQIAFIYGGRRLGKSALLRAVHRDARGQDGIRACYIDLQDKGVGERTPTSKVFDLIEEEFAGLLPVSRRHGPEARLADGVKQLIQDPEAPRLLVLLDEADRLIDLDSEQEFRTLSALRRLRDETEGKIRFVFAGLHSVRRFHDLVNQRLVQFGRSESIGALEPRAAQRLVQQPLEALGYRLDLASVNRILTLTQHQPSLIQVVCDELLKFLLARGRGPHTPPYKVSRLEVDRVLAQPSLTREIVDRFELTVRLDDRYRVVALVVAFLAAEDRMNATFEVEELWEECQSWWPAGFPEQSRDTVFDALLEEMVGLGVLYMRDNQYGLHSPHVGRMLGTQQQIAGRLREARRKPAPSRGFDGGALRLPLSPRRRTGQGREAKGSRVSPLNLRQVTTLQKPANDVHLIVGSRALDSGDLGDAMRELVNGADGLEVLPFTKGLGDEEEAKSFIGRLKTTSRRTDRVAFAEAGEISADRLFTILEGAMDMVRLRVDKQRVSAVIAIDEDGIGAWRELLVTGRDAELRFTTIELSRHTVDSLRVWAQRQDVDLPAFEKAESAEEILAATGGWPVLVGRVARDLLRHRNRKQALEALSAYMSDAGAAELVRCSGVTATTSLERAFRFFIEIADQGLEAVDAASMLAYDTGMSDAEADASWRVLRALDLLQISAADGTVRPEPVIAAAFAR